MNYTTEIKTGLEYKILKAEDIFDFSGTTIEELFVQFFNFCRENLDINSKLYEINPNVILFTNYNSSNACAIRTEKLFAILINRGLFLKAKENLLDNLELDEFIKNNFKDEVHYFDNSIMTLAFQMATQFSYYHELGHLIQFSKRKLESYLEENSQKCEAYNETKHILEINADVFASIAIASHIQQYIDKVFKDEITVDRIQNTIIILNAVLLNHIANFCENLDEFYLKEKCHPHPLIRLLSVNMNITEYLNQSDVFRKKGIKVNTNLVYNRTIELYGTLEGLSIFKTKFNNAKEEAKKYHREIVEYLHFLIHSKLEDYHDAINEWNKHIS